MNDELVKRLRDDEAWKNCDFDFIYGWMHEAADAIVELSRENESLAKSVNEASEILRKRWIPVSERLPETGVDVLVKFPQNMAVASIDIGEWVVNSGDGWCTDINLAGGEKNPTHWMPLPEPPKEE